MCGGSIHQSAEPSMVPSMEPSEKPSACLDVEDWISTQNDLTCEAFNEQSCVINYTNSAGVSNGSACCVCGGGLHTLD